MTWLISAVVSESKRYLLKFQVYVSTMRIEPVLTIHVDLALLSLVITGNDMITLGSH